MAGPATPITQRRESTVSLLGFLAHMLIFTVAVGASYLSRLNWELFYPLLGWFVGLILHGATALGACWCLAGHDGDSSARAPSAEI